MDKAARKRLKHQLRDHQRDASLRALPLATQELDQMFAAVNDEFKRMGCDKTRRLTKAWLVEHGHDVETVFAWLEEHSGYCDCEVLTNAAQHFEEAKQGKPAPAN